MNMALVLNGEVLAYRDFTPNVDQSLLAEGKPRWVSVEIFTDDYDPVSQVLDPRVTEIEADRVIWRQVAREKTENEIAAMIAAKSNEIEAEFNRLYCLPITHTLGGVDMMFHADGEARENIQGVLQMYNEADRMGFSLPDPRSWTPFGATDAISITRTELAALGIKIGARKDALYTLKKAMQKAVGEMTDPAQIDAVDPFSEWEIV